MEDENIFSAEIFFMPLPLKFSRRNIPMKQFDVGPLEGGFCPWALRRGEPSVNVAKRTNKIDKILRTD